MATPPRNRSPFQRPLTLRLNTKGMSIGPEPRLPGKHALNPPIVTIIGGGIAGLTAAHELVERGFYVQVVEQTPDPLDPTQPIVGGMAANQPARVRANIEDLHRDLMDTAKDQAAKEQKVATWLLGMFAFNRNAWIQTEAPAVFRRRLKLDELDDSFLKKHLKTIRDELLERRKAYRERWLWDLTVRGTLTHTFSHEDGSPIPINVAYDVLKALRTKTDPMELAKALLHYQAYDGVPTLKELEAAKDTVTQSLEREFLSVKTNAAHVSSSVVKTWAGHLKKELGGSICDDEGCDPNELYVEIVEQTLPGEHGFHFFPTFYRHIEDTLRRIPLTVDNTDIGLSVYDNLKPTVLQGLGFSDADLQVMVDAEGAEMPPDFTDPDLCKKDDPARVAAQPKYGGTVVDLFRDRPTSLEGLRDRTDRFVTRLGGTRRDAVWLFAKLMRFMMSCPERRRSQYEKISWANFLGIKKGAQNVAQPNLSRTMTHQITSAAQALLAFSSAEADARSYGDVAIQLLLDGLSDGSHVDQTLTGPTSEAWLDPWRDYLQGQGVRFFVGRVDDLDVVSQTSYDGGKPVDELVPRFAGQPPEGLLTHDRLDPGERPDFYVLALDVGAAFNLLKNQKIDPKQSPDFKAMVDFGTEIFAQPEPNALKDMTGLQFFFDAKTSIGQGHMYFPYTDWGLSSISQSEFWCKPGAFSEGYFGILSVGICDTGNFTKPLPGTFWEIMKDGKQAGWPFAIPDVDARRFEISRKVFEDLRTRIKSTDRLSQPRCFHVDQKITEDGNPSKFLASLYDVKAQRPGTVGGPLCVDDEEVRYSLNHIRWVMCGTHMATYTRITTMEAANESGRHAAKAILAALQKTDDSRIERGRVNKTPIAIKGLRNKTYNGASDQLEIDPPDLWNLEDIELDDLDLFRRVDRRLVKLGLPHLFDIIELDRKLKHTLDAVEIYGESGRDLSEHLGLAISGLDSMLTSALGQAYPDRVDKQTDVAKAAVGKLSDRLGSGAPFGEMKDLLGRLRHLIEVVHSIR